MTDFCKYAKRYAARGFLVFPVKEAGKAPLTPHGCKDATADAGIIESWWKRWPAANIGIATGGGIVVLDVDTKDANGFESLHQWEEECGELPETWNSITGSGGAHYFFRTDKKINNRAGVLPGLDVRGDGGYVVAPPSVHPSGGVYEWGVETYDLPAPANLPDDLFQLFTAGVSGERFKLDETIKSGQRNTDLFKYACSLQERGRSDEEIYALVSYANDNRTDSPLDSKELDTLIGSAMRYEKGADTDAEQAQNRAALEVATAGDGLSEAARNVLSEETIQAALNLQTIDEQEIAIADLQARAKSLKVKVLFDRRLKRYTDKKRREEARTKMNKIQFSDPPLSGTSSGTWTATDDGIWRMSEKGQEVACTHPILITERLCNIDTHTERLNLAFYKDNRWTKLTADRETVASRAKIVSLANNGISVTSETSQALVKFLSEYEAANVDLIPVHNSIDRLGWYDGHFSPFVGGIHFDGASENKSLFESIRTEGDYAEWLSLAKRVRAHGSPAARILLAASFASALVGPTKRLPFFVHIWSESEIGKTVGLMFAASVWGDPAELVRSFNGTQVGLERTAAFLHSVPMFLDELQTLRNSWTGNGNNFDQFIYNLCEGVGKTRGQKTGGVERQNRWQNVFISSGEQPLTHETSGGGARNRTIEISTNRPLFDDAPHVADTVRETYGHAGRRFISAIINNDFLKKYDPIARKAQKELEELGYTSKQSMSAGLLIMADRLADDILFKDGHGITVSTIKNYLIKKSELNVGLKAYNWTKSWIAVNRGHFIVVEEPDPENPLDNGIRSPVNNIDLYGRIFEGSRAQIIGTTYRKAMEADGINYDAAIKSMGDQGFIQPDTRTRKNVKGLSLSGMKVKGVEVILDIESEKQLSLVSGNP